MPHITEHVTPESMTVAQWQALQHGDQLRCVNADGNRRVEVGKIYTFHKRTTGVAGECFLTVEEWGLEEFFAGRFALVNPVTDHTRALLDAFTN